MPEEDEGTVTEHTARIPDVLDSFANLFRIRKSVIYCSPEFFHQLF